MKDKILENEIIVVYFGTISFLVIRKTTSEDFLLIPVRLNAQYAMSATHAP